MTLTLTHIIVLLVTGAVTGFAGGMLGVGGAFIMTPIQYMVYISMGIPADSAIRLAFGTGLLVILPLSISGTWRHHKEKTVWWKAALIMGGCSMLAALGGATVSAHLPAQVLKMTFGALIVAVSVRLLFSQQLLAEEKPQDNPWLWVAWALPIGFINGLVGIGGGTLVVPMMVLALHFNIHKAIATSLAMIMFTSAGGVLGYILNGINVPDLPLYAIGYVYLPAWFLLSITSSGMAQVGALTAYKLPARQLRFIFAVLMFFMGLKMLGVFDWLGWPI